MKAKAMWEIASASLIGAPPSSLASLPSLLLLLHRAGHWQATARFA
jgi:hypothetical protein